MTDEDPVSTLHSFAAQALTRGDAPLALVLSIYVVELDQENARAAELEATAAFRARRYDIALAASEKAIELGGITEHRALLRAGSLRELGQHEAALDTLRQVRSRLPRSADIYVNLADAALECGAMEEAASAVEVALELNPNWMPAHDVAARIAEHQGDTESQLEQERSLFELSGHAPTVSRRFAKTLFAAGEEQQARGVLIDALAVNPRDRAARRMLVESVRQPRWAWRLVALLPLFTWLLAVAVIAVTGMSPSASQPFSLAALWAGFPLRAKVRKAWVRRVAGSDADAVLLAMKDFVIPWRTSFKFHYWYLMALLCLVWAPPIAILALESTGWALGVRWLVTVVPLAGIVALTAWGEARIVRMRKARAKTYKRYPIDPSRCNCVRLQALQGDQARSYFDRHLGGSHRQLANDVWVAKCPTTDVPWALVDREVWDGGLRPVVVQFERAEEASNVGLYL